MKLTLKLIKLIVLCIGLQFMFSSCVSQKKSMYLQQVSQATTKSAYKGSRQTNYKVKEGDNLYIKVVSIDESTSRIFNPNATGAVSTQNDAGIYLNSYTVNENGYITFPITGDILVKNKSIDEIREELQDEINKYLKQSVVILKLVNFNITFVGEVNQPREYKVYQENINLFEAIALAGDLTEFANKKRVQLVRQTEEGSEIIKLDLTSADILSSKYYYLQPNDVIYVEPLKAKQFAFKAFPYTVILSAISTTILLLNYFK